jgi:hypothetical protein
VLKHDANRRAAEAARIRIFAPVAPFALTVVSVRWENRE